MDLSNVWYLVRSNGDFSFEPWIDFDLYRYIYIYVCIYIFSMVYKFLIYLGKIIICLTKYTSGQNINQTPKKIEKYLYNQVSLSL